MLANEMAARLVDGDAVLDVGCGDGHLLARLRAARAIDPHGVDLDYLAGEVHAIPRTSYDGRTLPFRRHAFDVSILAFVLHHLSPTEAVALFAEVVRTTRRQIFVLEDSLPELGALDRLRNRFHRIEAGLRYRRRMPAFTAVYATPPDEAMFLTHTGWETWLDAHPGVARVERVWFGHRQTLFVVALA